jgi:CheY-like chemotaxis protein
MQGRRIPPPAGCSWPGRPGTPMLALYEERLVSLWARVVRTLGIHTARVLLERAIKQTAQRHPDIALLQHDDGGLTFEALETRYATRPHEEIEAAFTDLSAELRLILARLLRQVLVIDDDEGIRDLVAAALSALGYGVVSVGDGATALERLATLQPAVILLDMLMPTMDGWEFARLYEERPGPHAPIIVLTAAHEAQARAAEINADAWLAKPFHLVDLYACIDHWSSQGCLHGDPWA